MSGSDGSRLVTVITPTYQHERYIADCIQSVVRQTYPNWEQIIIDDGSTDGTPEAVHQFADARIRYVRQEHKGIWQLAKTYNRALDLARGDLIAILEGDDFYHPSKLARLVPLMSEGIVLAYGQTALVAAGKVLEATIPDARMHRRFGMSALSNQPVGAATKVMLQGGLVPTFPCSVIVSRSALESLGGFQYVEGLGTVDFPTFLTLSLAGRFAYLPEVVAYWRRHEWSQAWTNNDEMMRTEEAFARRFLEEHGAQLHITGRSRAEFERAWIGSRALTGFRTGRRYLVERRWPDARRRFAAALRTRSPVLFLAALAGYAASWIGKDLEGVAKMAGRTHFRRH